METVPPSSVFPHHRVAVCPTGSGLTLSGQTERLRFYDARRASGARPASIFCRKNGDPWVGVVADDEGLRRLSAVLRFVGARPGVPIVAHLIDPETRLVGQIDVGVV